MSANAYQFFARQFRTHAARVFLETPDGAALTFAELDRQSARYARTLIALGAAKGERLLAQVDKSIANVLLYLGCLRAGLVYVPLNTAYQQAELEYFIGDALPAIFVCRPQSLANVAALAAKAGVRHVLSLDDAGGGSLIDALQGATGDACDIACTERDLASILYTSGTTGRSKGAMLTHGNLASNAQTLVKAWGMGAQDVLIHALPTFHIHGLFVALHTTLLASARVIFLSKFDAREVIEHLPRASLFMGVPTYYTRLLESPALDAARCAKMRLFVSGSAPLLAETFNAFRARTGHTILERYGMSETGMNTSNPLEGERKAGTVGLPLPGVDVRVADERDQPVAPNVPNAIGGIQVRGPNVFAGYWRRPELNEAEFTRDGFFRTGDMGQFDADGYLTIVGRSKDIVISGGLNIYPKEIESYLDEIEGVQESAVIGVPHPDFGEALVAVLVCESDSNMMTEQYLIEYMKKAIAGFKVPKRIVRVDELPRNAMGKVQKNVLRERYRALFAANS